MFDSRAGLDLRSCTIRDAGPKRGRVRRCQWCRIRCPSGGASGAPSGGASGAPSAGGSGSTAVVQISATGIKYDQTDVTVAANAPFQIQFANNDAGTPHNVAIHQGGPTGPELFKGEIFNGVGTRTYDVPKLDAGQYSFVCSVHPTMTGTPHRAVAGAAPVTAQ